MGGLTLLDRARAAGLSVTAEGKRLVIRGPKRADTIARELITHKVEVLAALGAPPPDPSVWRSVLPFWPIPWRERWGRRANELAKSGIRWPDDEARAFAEVSAERQNHPMPLAEAETTATTTPATTQTPYRPARPKQDQGRLRLEADPTGTKRP
jgi:hypothetical protein